MKIELSYRLIDLLHKRKKLLDGDELEYESDCAKWMAEFNDVSGDIARELSVDYFFELKKAVANVDSRGE